MALGLSSRLSGVTRGTKSRSDKTRNAPRVLRLEGPKRKGEEAKERKGKERKGKERKGKERKGKERGGVGRRGSGGHQELAGATRSHREPTRAKRKHHEPPGATGIHREPPAAASGHQEPSSSPVWEYVLPQVSWRQKKHVSTKLNILCQENAFTLRASSCQTTWCKLG